MDVLPEHLNRDSFRDSLKGLVALEIIIDLPFGFPINNVISLAHVQRMCEAHDTVMRSYCQQIQLTSTVFTTPQMTPMMDLGLPIRVSMDGLRETGDWDIRVRLFAPLLGTLIGSLK